MVEVARQVRIEDIRDSPDNERDHSKGIPELMASIEDAGFIGTIALRSHEDPTIVAGHGRVEALRRLGWDEVPDDHIEWLDDLDDEQVERFRLNDNRTGDLSRWNKAKLKASVRRLESRGVDMTRFGFDFESKRLDYGAERLKTDRAYNLHLISRDDCEGGAFPSLPPVDVRPGRLVGFNYVLTMDEGDKAGAACHFFIDDYQFERLWTSPERYVDKLRGFGCVIEPDFSLYLDMPDPMQRWNRYRSRALARWWADQGITVVPNLTWAQPETFGWVFAGTPEGSTVAVSSVGVARDEDSREVFREGLMAAMDACRPARVLWYGPDLGIPLDAEVVRFTNERFNTRP